MSAAADASPDQPMEATSARSARAPVVLSEQEEQIIRACCRYQYLTVTDCCYVLGMPRSRSYVRKVLSRLAGSNDYTPGRYLYKFPLPKTTAGGAWRVYVPGTASRALLRRAGEESLVIWNRPSTMQGYSYSYVSHNLAVTRLALCAVLFVQEHPSYYLAETRLSYEMAVSPPRVRLGLEAQETPMAVIADCWVWLKQVTDDRGFGLWLEVDNATTSKTAFQRRLRARLALIESGAYAGYFGTPAILLCYAVIGTDQKRREGRCETLRQWTKDVLVKDQYEDWAQTFRFAAIEYETLYEQRNALFLQPVWHLPGHSQPVALLTPPNEQEE